MYTNVWYVAARSEDLKDEPFLVRMLGCDFVLYRDLKGEAACLSNVCPHRGASLADGKTDGNGSLACPYHGWQFNGQGQCTLIPSRRDEDPQDVAPGIKTDAYPTVEKYGFISTFLGDEPENAAPLFEIKEWDDEAFRGTPYSEVWNANYHWAKFSNLDLVHLPVVHGIQFQNQENPIAPPPSEVEDLENGFTLVYYPSAGIRKGGKWEDLRDGDEAKKVKSQLVFGTAGFMLHGKVEIGGVGSGMHNVFYEFSTPIDEQTTAMHYIFFRNFMLDPNVDEEHVKRNLANVHQDKAIAEAQRPKIAMVEPDPDGFYTEDEDPLIKRYWNLMAGMREWGWQIDRQTWAEAGRDGRCRVVPSPLRGKETKGWAHDPVPRFAKGSAFRTVQ
jgi:phenylpropionate dioxygenase-like ring-hydroxylating dioxygenase large terminal subunit